MNRVLFLLALIYCSNAYAQKLPNKQETSLRIPAKIKFDGQATEINDKFEAYNNTVEAFYTISNDDEAIYFAFKSTIPLISRKVVAGGVTFSIKAPGKGKDVTVTYPYITKSNKLNINLRKAPSSGEQERLDSVILASNKEITAKTKKLSVQGVTEFNDDSLSIYNDYDIKVASKFNNSLAYVYELSIPLKTLGVPIKQLKEITYTIALNGSMQVEGATFEYITGGTRIISPTPDRPKREDMIAILSPTNCSGTYILKK